MNEYARKMANQEQRNKFHRLHKRFVNIRKELNKSLDIINDIGEQDK